MTDTDLYPILLQPHPTLTAVAEPAAGATAEVLAVLEKMLKTLYRADGVGLAAPQVDVRQRLVVMDLGEPREDGRRDYSIKKPQFLINPKVIWASEEMATLQEGCLSLPNLWGMVDRPAVVKVAFTDRDGQAVEAEFNGLGAAVVQHEIDHLDGILFPQRMSKVRRDIAMGKWQKLRKDVVKNGTNFDVYAAEAGVIPAKRK